MLEQNETTPEQNETTSEQSVDNLQAQIISLKTKLAAEGSGREKLENKREELLTEVKKLKRVDRALLAAGIDVNADDLEDRVAAFLHRQPAEAKPANEKPVETFADPILKAEIAKLTRQLEAMAQKTEEAERREQVAIAKQKEDKIERLVVDALSKGKCQRPVHVFKLKKNDFRLSDDGETVLWGPEYDPKTLGDLADSLKDDDEFDIYFTGNGMSGSGVGTKNSQLGSTESNSRNPFSTDSLNATEAARIYKNQPEKAKRLMAEARSLGKLEPSLGKFLT